LANDEDQSVGRVFRAISRIISASPLLVDSADILSKEIELPSTGATIQALASDAPGSAGANPNCIVFDELWGYTSERSHRLWDEMIPPPTRKVACRLTVTYAGFEGESDLLEKLYKRGLKGEEIAPDLYRQPGMLMYWTHECVAPWQTPEWKAQMREQLRPNAYLRMIENRWVSTESEFVDPAWWDACVIPSLSPAVCNPDLLIWVGVDASVKKDSTAIVGCGWNESEKRVRLVWHRIFQPTKEAPLDFEATIEETLLDLNRRFNLREVRYDPYQMVGSAQRLQKAGLPMVEFPQTVGNLTEASSNLYDLIKGKNLLVYPDDAMRLAVNRAVALETSRGWRIAKEKASHKIDVVVALAQAALGAVKRAGAGRPAINSQAIKAVVVQHRTELPFVWNRDYPREYRAHCVFSGRDGDPVPVAIGHLQTQDDGSTKQTLDVIREIRCQSSQDSIKALVGLLRAYRIDAIRGDEQTEKRLRNELHGYSVKFWKETEPRAELYERFVSLVNAGQVEILDHPRLIRQLSDLEQVTLHEKESIQVGLSGDDLLHVAASVLVGPKYVCRMIPIVGW